LCAFTDEKNQFLVDKLFHSCSNQTSRRKPMFRISTFN
jgi:hypothetical protein